MQARGIELHMSAEILIPRPIAVVSQWLLLGVFLFWLGGFSFYMAVVIPTGSEVVGTRTQGFITQQVTHYINLFCLIATVGMLVDWVQCFLRSRRESNEVISTLICGVCAILIGACLAILYPLHIQLDELIDPDENLVYDEVLFYGKHRIYLWISTLQFVMGWVWLFARLWIWNRRSGPMKGV